MRYVVTLGLIEVPIRPQRRTAPRTDILRVVTRTVAMTVLE